MKFGRFLLLKCKHSLQLSKICIKPIVPVFVISCAFLFICFNHGYTAFRISHHIGEDLLDYFLYLHDWFDNGFPLTGHTLHPAPGYIELIIQAVISFFTGDVEIYSYWLSLAFCLILFLSLWAMLVVANRQTLLSAPIAAVSASLFYLFAPFHFKEHLFLDNHVMANILAPLGLALFLKTMSEPRLLHSRWALLLLCFVFVLTVSDSFILVNFVLPAIAVCVFLIASPRLPFARLKGMTALLITASLAGLGALSLIHAAYWPHRVDFYPNALRLIDETTLDITNIHALALFFTDKDMRLVTATIPIAVTGSVLYLLFAWRRYHAVPDSTKSVMPDRIIAVSFGLFCFLSCLLTPVLRGRFANGYEYRYLIAPALLAITGLTTAAMLGTGCLLQIILPRKIVASDLRHPLLVLGIMVALLVAAGATFSMPPTVDSDRSHTKTMLACINKAEQDFDLHHGIGSIRPAKFITASHYSRPYRRHSIVILNNFNKDYSYVDVLSGNVYWFSGRGLDWLDPIDYIAWDDDFDAPEQKKNIAGFIGEPDQTTQCPLFDDAGIYHTDSQKTLTLWIYKDKEKLARLRNLIVRDNNRGVFWPGSKSRVLDIDLVYGMASPDGEGELRGDTRVWQKSRDKPEGRFAYTKPIFLPAGRYRVNACLAAEPAGHYPAAVMSVESGGKILAQQDISADQGKVSAEFEVTGKGGPTSGTVTGFAFFARAAQKLSMCGLSVERIGNRGRFDPFSIFH